MKRFTATFEILKGQGAVVVTLFDGAEWSGSGRIEIRSRRRSDLYEAGYRAASMAAVAKGGILDRFSEA
jgi:hypothetical protein